MIERALDLAITALIGALIITLGMMLYRYEWRLIEWLANQ